MKDSLYTLAYAAILGAVCAVFLTGAGWVTKKRREDNKLAEEVRNILGVLNAPFESDASSEQLVDQFEQFVKESKLGDRRLFSYTEPGGDEPVRAVEFHGPGLWGPIKGFLSLESDGKTIRGITFHEQEETPGLGGEIASEGFRAQFKGKSIESPDGTPGMRILRGRRASDVNEVDGISGATMTCQKVEAMLKSLIEQIVEERRSHGQ